MAKGLDIPVRASQGRAVVVVGDVENRKIVALCMSDGENDNPFNQDVGLDPMVFALDTDTLRGAVEQRIQAHFRTLELADRAQLSSVRFENRGPTGAELWARIAYVDLETDKPEEVEARIGQG